MTIKIITENGEYIFSNIFYISHIRKTKSIYIQFLKGMPKEYERFVNVITYEKIKGE